VITFGTRENPCLHYTPGWQIACDAKGLFLPFSQVQAGAGSDQRAHSPSRKSALYVPGERLWGSTPIFKPAW
jgi:hypothetical protein